MLLFRRTFFWRNRQIVVVSILKFESHFFICRFGIIIIYGTSKSPQQIGWSMFLTSQTCSNKRRRSQTMCKNCGWNVDFAVGTKIDD